MTLNWEISHESVPAHYLNSLMSTECGSLRGMKLGHGSLFREGLLVVFQLCCPPVEGSRGFNLEGHVREFELDRLKLANWSSKRLPLVGIPVGMKLRVKGLGFRGLGLAHGESGFDKPSTLNPRPELLELQTTSSGGHSCWFGDRA